MSTLYGTLSGVLTGLFILLFTGIVIWAWSSRRRESFEASARLPLEEDPHLNRSPDRERIS
jgi:cytochrome c oxidase cbb3-type subunit 4